LEKLKFWGAWWIRQAVAAKYPVVEPDDNKRATAVVADHTPAAHAAVLL
jgi:hypothetical protein